MITISSASHHPRVHINGRVDHQKRKELVISEPRRNIVKINLELKNPQNEINQTIPFDFLSDEVQFNRSPCKLINLKSS